MGRKTMAPGAAGLHLVDGLSLLRPEEQVFDAMLDGWRNQQLARNLAFSTIGGREKAVRAFARHADAFPWRWTASQVDEWLGDLRAVRNLKRSTLRNYQEAVHSFCAYLTDPAYQWSVQCEQRFGTHPVQVVHQWNTAVHVADAEADAGKRAFTRKELIALFDHADEQVVRIRAAGRKGWLPAFRDAALLKTAYAFGLRRNEIRMLDVVDFAAIRTARSSASTAWSTCGTARRRRARRPSVAACWLSGIGQPRSWPSGSKTSGRCSLRPARWPAGPRSAVRGSGLSSINTRLAAYRDELGLDPALDFHSLRRSISRTRSKMATTLDSSSFS